MQASYGTDYSTAALAHGAPRAVNFIKLRRGVGLSLYHVPYHDDLYNAFLAIV